MWLYRRASIVVFSVVNHMTRPTSLHSSCRSAVVDLIKDGMHASTATRMLYSVGHVV